ncbi:hypothetical protein TNCV_4314651 [Trichonephila clavipes]|nr:hypothetical protein TNCV_4314651 [Trichonephila clavipes]
MNLKQPWNDVLKERKHEHSPRRVRISKIYEIGRTKFPNLLQGFKHPRSPSMEPQHSALTGAPQDHRIFYSLWKNVRLLDVWPHQITKFSSHRGEMSDIRICCLTRSPDFFLSIYTSTFSTYRSPKGSPNFLLVVEKCHFLMCCPTR